MDRSDEARTIHTACLEVKYRYYEMCPLSVLDVCIRSIPSWPSLEAQECLIDTVYPRQLSTTHPYRPPMAYRKCFLKRLNQILEQDIGLDDDVGVCDSIAEAIIETYHATSGVDNRAEQNDNIAYLCYHLPYGRARSDAVNESPTAAPLVPLRTERSYNEVGMTVWGAGLFLAELCLCTDLLAGIITKALYMNVTLNILYLCFL
jgi:hypothetical protein